MPRQKIYLLSAEFDYRQCISSTYGPTFARRMGWHTSSVRNIQDFQNHVAIIDNRITENECAFLKAYIDSHSAHLCVFKIEDPYEHWRKHFYYQLLLNIRDARNVLFMTHYLPVGFTKDLDDATGNRKMILAPYALPEDYQSNFEYDKRIKKILFSGRATAHIYPERDKFLQWATELPLFREKVFVLEHPGYPDIGHEQRHSIVGLKYIDFASQFLFMFVSPSVFKLEFLKYAECATARCVPIGLPPASFNCEMLEPFITFDFDAPVESLEMLFSLTQDELTARSNRFHAAVKKHRNAERLNVVLDQFLERAKEGPADGRQG